MELTPEKLAKAKMTKSAEELLAFAKENGINLTDEEAKNYFSQWHQEGELSDEELGNVAGGSYSIDGSCYSDDPPHRLITTLGNFCNGYYYGGEGLDDGFCSHCFSLTKFPGSLTYYCDKRKADNDPYR